jgi:predicted site-specific integrase-resolvase
MQAQHDQWLNTSELCRELSISRSTLCRWQKRKLLRQGVHWVRKNPAASRSAQLWSRQACLALRRKR